MDANASQPRAAFLFAACIPLVLTRDGEAIAALVRIQDADLESFLVSESPVFKRIVRRSRASYKRSRGLTREQLEEGLAKTRGA